MNGIVKIECPIFQEEEGAVNSIIVKVNEAGRIKEKAKFAEELLKKANVLLSCSEFDPEKVDCLNCRIVYKLRHRTASLIIKTEKLAE